MREWSKVALWSVLLWACADPTRSPLRAPESPPQVLTHEGGAADSLVQAEQRSELPLQVLTQECGGVRVQLALDRTRHSASVADVFVTDAAGHMLSDISRVVLAFTRKTQMSITTTLVARLKEDGHCALTSEFPLTPGPWIIEVFVRRVSGSAVSCPFSFNL
jgi:hypothetical protein